MNNVEFENETLEKNIINVDDPRDGEYGGFWYKKGYASQKALISFYEKFGFYEDSRVHIDWHCYGSIPYPSMLCCL